MFIRFVGSHERCELVMRVGSIAYVYNVLVSDLAGYYEGSSDVDVLKAPLHGFVEHICGND
jgi:hypothetical protein